MEQYALIMRNEDGQKIATPDQLQMWMKQTKEWIDTITAKNKFVSGTSLLFEDARVINSGKEVENKPFGKTKETIGGYMIVKAESMNEAVAFAKDCPVLQGEGNTMEVRQVAKQ